MRHNILGDPAIGIQVEQRLLNLANRLARATGESTPLGLKKLVEVSDTYRHTLAGRQGERVGEYTAQIALRELCEPRELEDPKFWETALGRACAWWIGGVGESVPRVVAATLLGCTRQNIYDLISRNTLVEVIGGGVTPDSVRRFLRNRDPLDFEEAAGGNT